RNFLRHYAQRPVRSTLHTRHFPELDFIRHDRGVGDCAAEKTSGDAAALSRVGVSSGTSSFCICGAGAALFDVVELAAGIGDRFGADCGGTSLLFLLECAPERGKKRCPGRDTRSLEKRYIRSRSVPFSEQTS